jgi:hypothetical protein
MIERIRAGESLQVLLFVVLPVVLLLFGFAIRWALQPSPYVATFPTFSVTLVKLGRDTFGLEACSAGSPARNPAPPKMRRCPWDQW